VASISSSGRPAGRAWQNWAGSSRCEPAAVAYPASREELVDVVRSAAAAGRTVKAVGSGHSFPDIACTTGVQVRLSRYRKVLAHDLGSATVTVQAGITIAALSRELARLGLALENVGDIGYQTITGAISTGTHGTGLRFPCLAAQVVGLELVTGDGAVLACSREENPEVLAAARVGLGALGLISTVTLRCRPAFNLLAVEEPLRLDHVLAHLDELVEANDHFELFWVPHTDWCLTKRNNRSPLPAGRAVRLREWGRRALTENVAFGAACRLGRRWPGLTPRLAPLVAGGRRRQYVDRSDRVFSSPRWVRFVEMEYSIPRRAASSVIGRVRRLVDEGGLRVSFPVEVRFAAGDDIPLSPAYGEERCFVAVHMYRGVAYEGYFRGVEAIMDSVGGRPHWGKLHSQTAATLAPRYPEWDRFRALRRRLDPGARFANPHLDRVLGRPDT
jgi:L-gulono-1,4-lactone dehydrogenase